MRTLQFTNTAIDLNAQKVPFLPNYTVQMQNTDAGSVVVQECDTSGGTYTTLVTLAAAGAAGCVQDVKLNKQFIKVSTAKVVTAQGN